MADFPEIEGFTGTKPRLQRNARAQPVGISMSEDDLKYFDELSTKYGLSKSAMFRHILNFYKTVTEKIEPKQKAQKKEIL